MAFRFLRKSIVSQYQSLRSNDWIKGAVFGMLLGIGIMWLLLFILPWDTIKTIGTITMAILIVWSVQSLRHGA